MRAVPIYTTDWGTIPLGPVRVKRCRAVERQLRLSYVPIGPAVRLYRLDAAGVHNEELLHEASWQLYARCLDILLISDSKVGRLECRAEFTVRWRGALVDRVAECRTAVGP